MNTIQIDVWSDVVCPFCYLGKMKLELAIDKLKIAEQTNVTWHSFQLDPNFPKNTSAPAIEHLKTKGYSLEQVEASQQRLTDLGKNYGIEFQFSKAINFNTFDAHRLLHWSKAFQKATELKTALLKAHFTSGVDLSNTENLLTTIAQVGLAASEAKSVLTSSHYASEVQQDINLARQIGINGVPFFVFNKKQAISGAQADSVFEEVLSESLKVG